jgi:hypothetical protein
MSKKPKDKNFFKSAQSIRTTPGALLEHWENIKKERNVISKAGCNDDCDK